MRASQRLARHLPVVLGAVPAPCRPSADYDSQSPAAAGSPRWRQHATLATGHEIAKSSPPDFRDTIHFHELKRYVFVPSLTDFTSVGETLAVVELCDMFSVAGQKCRVQQSRLVNLDEIKEENSILLGGSQTWSGPGLPERRRISLPERHHPQP